MSEKLFTAGIISFFPDSITQRLDSGSHTGEKAIDKKLRIYLPWVVEDDSLLSKSFSHPDNLINSSG